jgi:hypothetical protein
MERNRRNEDEQRQRVAKSCRIFSGCGSEDRRMGKIGYGIHRVQIRGTGSGLRNRLRRYSKKAFMRLINGARRQAIRRER